MEVLDLAVFDFRRFIVLTRKVWTLQKLQLVFHYGYKESFLALMQMSLCQQRGVERQLSRIAVTNETPGVLSTFLVFKRYSQKRDIAETLFCLSSYTASFVSRSLDFVHILDYLRSRSKHFKYYENMRHDWRINGSKTISVVELILEDNTPSVSTGVSDQLKIIRALAPSHQLEAQGTPGEDSPSFPSFFRF